MHNFYFTESFTKLSPLLQEILDSKMIIRELADFTLKASTPGTDYKTLLSEYPNIAMLIDTNIPQINTKETPFAGGFEIASLPK